MSCRNKLILFVGLLAFIDMVFSANIKQATSPALSTGLFAADLLGHITKDHSSENVVFSPLSIQTALAMVYLGAARNTAEELRNVLHLQPYDNVDQFGLGFAQILNENAGEAELSIANRIFVNSDFQLRPEFNERSQKYFNSEAEKMNFKGNPLENIATINRWVEDKTKGKILNLMKSGSLNRETVAVIANAIYFKGNWEKPFNTAATFKSSFYVNKDESVTVDTMSGIEHFKYGEFPELDATGIEMAYKNSNLSMLLLMPTQRDGLASMEAKMNSNVLIQLSSKMSLEKVDVTIPKFKIEFTIGLNDILQKMGIHSLFKDAKLPGMFQSRTSVKFTNVQHKAYIEVYEAGSEAAGATSIGMAPSADFYMKYLHVDHPFLFAIKSPDAVYFVGHVVKF